MATIFYTASTLDGFLATEDHSLEWLMRQDFDQEGPMAYPAFVQNVGALVMGRSTYEWLREHEDKWGYSQPTWVFTHQDLPLPDGADVRIVGGSVSENFESIEASAQGKDVWVVGGGDLASQFAAAGHLDEIWVQFAPVMLGNGQPLFTQELDLELVELAQNRAFVCTRYRVLKNA
ncbi:dihydrofolate reductase [Neomicrococcus aestuarii]|uniref:Dihydrofolate reductase n=1 Tax=Neomicrococcus aestuarii TaxID=556325 RepID=A0A7W8TT88_9MICC|nr:dihydrofolate reductase family protein [Neomicrococcus aestuarii]MBB5512505.1 dihydrofolate reductase [Neomicrococcus aestuarii]